MNEKDDIQSLWLRPITEEWLKSVGFKWHQHERQLGKAWLLWMGGADGYRLQSFEDLGRELHWTGYPDADCWSAFLRGDTAGRYHRFIHIRKVRGIGEVVGLVEALSGVPWNVERHIYGRICTEKEAQHISHERQRLDHLIREECPKWQKVEKDDSRSAALPEHMEEAIPQEGKMCSQ